MALRRNSMAMVMLLSSNLSWYMVRSNTPSASNFHQRFVCWVFIIQYTSHVCRIIWYISVLHWDLWYISSNRSSLASTFLCSQGQVLCAPEAGPMWPLLSLDISARFSFLVEAHATIIMSNRKPPASTDRYIVWSRCPRNQQQVRFKPVLIYWRPANETVLHTFRIQMIRSTVAHKSTLNLPERACYSLFQAYSKYSH